MNKKTWNEFQKSGLLWFINTILHLFGWAIVIQKNNDEIDVYPARVKFRGFTEHCNTEGYEKITNFLNDNIGQLMEDLND